MKFLGPTIPVDSRDLPSTYQPSSSANATFSPTDSLKKTVTSTTTGTNGSMGSASTTIHHKRSTYINMGCTITKKCKQEHCSILKNFLTTCNLFKRLKYAPTDLAPLPQVAGANSTSRRAAIMDTSLT